MWKCCKNGLLFVDDFRLLDYNMWESSKGAAMRRRCGTEKGKRPYAAFDRH